MMRFLSFVVLTCALPSLAAQAATPMDSNLRVALDLLYNSKFEASRSRLDLYSGTHPDDPLAYALRAASFLFAELDQSGAMKKTFLTDDRNLSDAKSPQNVPTANPDLIHAIGEAREHGSAVLAKDPNDRSGLLAMCIVAGVQRDHLALVEHRMRDSYEYIKESQSYATRLLRVDPTAYDAYLTKGFTEYLVASLPFYLRWLMKMDDITGTKQQGLLDLRVAADSGQYMKPFAQLLLAMFYLREKQTNKTEQLLGQLSSEYPNNALFRSELEQFEVHRHAGTN